MYFHFSYVVNDSLESFLSGFSVASVMESSTLDASVNVQAKPHVNDLCGVPM
jgi:hypothetical protein